MTHSYRDLTDDVLHELAAGDVYVVTIGDVEQMAKELLRRRSDSSADRVQRLVEMNDTLQERAHRRTEQLRRELAEKTSKLTILEGEADALRKQVKKLRHIRKKLELQADERVQRLAKALGVEVCAWKALLGMVRPVGRSDLTGNSTESAGDWEMQALDALDLDEED